MLATFPIMTQSIFCRTRVFSNMLTRPCDHAIMWNQIHMTFFFLTIFGLCSTCGRCDGWSVMVFAICCLLYFFSVALLQRIKIEFVFVVISLRRSESEHSQQLFFSVQVDYNALVIRISKKKIKIKQKYVNNFHGLHLCCSFAMCQT